MRSLVTLAAMALPFAAHAKNSAKEMQLPVAFFAKKIKATPAAGGAVQITTERAIKHHGAGINPFMHTDDNFVTAVVAKGQPAASITLHVRMDYTAASGYTSGAPTIEIGGRPVAMQRAASGDSAHCPVNRVSTAGGQFVSSAGFCYGYVVATADVDARTLRPLAAQAQAAGQTTMLPYAFKSSIDASGEFLTAEIVALLNAVDTARAR